MTTLQQEVRTCPVCEARFPISMVTSSGSFGADSDFRPRFWGPDPTEHFVQACLQCGFSGTEEDFMDGVTEGVIRKIRKFLTPRTRDLTKPSGSFYKYEFLALIYEWEDRSSRDVGDGFCVRRGSPEERGTARRSASIKEKRCGDSKKRSRWGSAERRKSAQ